MTSRVTLIIPTLNRPQFVSRELSYYENSGFVGKVLIADSSDDQRFDATKRWLEKTDPSFSIRHLRTPGLSVGEAIREAVNVVDSPYAAIIPDDDFLVTTGIACCARFLDQHSNYEAAHGKGILVESPDGRANEVSAAQYYVQPEVLAISAADRVTHLLRNYSVTLFSVHRTRNLARVFKMTPSAKDSPLCSDKAFFNELQPCILLAAYGNVAQTDCFYLVRQTHNSRYLLPGWYDWFINEKWRPSFVLFRDNVTSALCQIDGISPQSAQQIFDRGFAEYLRCAIAIVPDASKAIKTRLRNLARQYLPRTSKKVMRRWLSPYSLDALMDNRSPYHEEFLQVYSAIQTTASDSFAN